ncbi:thiol-disulfide oxidoreductase DCC family protein [Reyranella sp.]|uniref:thiol-disulfide oxidoreductase DCC family protein n=1 Tax=Reyranella sp. TaxID=1929291 RepID=UPI003D0F07D8
MKIPPALAELPQPLYFFDGQCVLCSRFVAFCLKRDADGRLRFASAQSALGKRVLAALDLPHDTLDHTILLLEDGQVHTRSTAALRALRHLRGPARFLYPMILLPKILRDPIYDVVARNRIRWFGRLDSCLVPSPQTRDRFIDL